MTDAKEVVLCTFIRTDATFRSYESVGGCITPKHFSLEYFY